MRPWSFEFGARSGEGLTGRREAGGGLGELAAADLGDALLTPAVWPSDSEGAGLGRGDPEADHGEDRQRGDSADDAPGDAADLAFAAADTEHEQGDADGDADQCGGAEEALELRAGQDVEGDGGDEAAGDTEVAPLDTDPQTDDEGDTGDHGQDRIDR